MNRTWPMKVRLNVRKYLPDPLSALVCLTVEYSEWQDQFPAYEVALY